MTADWHEVLEAGSLASPSQANAQPLFFEDDSRVATHRAGCATAGSPSCPDPAVAAVRPLRGRRGAGAHQRRGGENEIGTSATAATAATRRCQCRGRMRRRRRDTSPEAAAAAAVATVAAAGGRRPASSTRTSTLAKGPPARVRGRSGPHGARWTPARGH